MKPAFITDSDLLQQLEGRQFIVFRPGKEIANYYKLVQEQLKAKLPSKAKYPNTGHITLRGFSDKVDKLNVLLSHWAAKTHPLDVSVEGIDSFPAPSKIIILKIQSSQMLKNAYDELSAVVNTNHLSTIDIERSSDEWIFHMSLAYCSELNGIEWHTALGLLKELQIQNPYSTVSKAELVQYEGGEHSFLLELGNK